MKKAFSLIAIALMALTLTACHDDDDVQEQKRSAVVTSLQVTTVSGDNVINESTAAARLDIDYTKRQIDVDFEGISFAPRMPAVNFDIDDIPMTFTDQNHATFESLQSINVIDGYSVSYVAGTFDLVQGTFYMRFIVNNSYTVIVRTPNVFSRLSNSSLDYEGATEPFYEFSIFVDPSARTQSDIRMYNVQFAPTMPTLEMIRIPLAEAEITSTAKGYQIECGEVVPYFRRGTTESPMSERTITNLQVSLDIVNGLFTVEFDCYGLHFSEYGSLNVPPTFELY